MRYKACMRALLSFVSALLVAGCLTGCITRDEHDFLMNEQHGHMLNMQQQHRLAMQGEGKKIVTLEVALTKLQQEITERDRAIEEQNRQLSELQTKLDDSTALNEQLTSALEKAGKSVDKLVSETGTLSKALEDSKARLEELRRAQEAANKRAELFKNLLLKFKKLVDGGELKIVMRDGRMVLQLRNDVLFQSGKVDVKQEGKEALTEVAQILVTIGDRKFQVVGHTDNVPIATERFPSNWELSAARAISVVKYLIEKGVKPELLSAAGYGEYDPVSANDSAEGKAKNRRIEIVLQPNLAELVQVPEVQ
jgi:chemotaxis protein MotB